MSALRFPIHTSEGFLGCHVVSRVFLAARRHTGHGRSAPGCRDPRGLRRHDRDGDCGHARLFRRARSRQSGGRHIHAVAGRAHAQPDHAGCPFGAPRYRRAGPRRRDDLGDAVGLRRERSPDRVPRLGPGHPLRLAPVSALARHLPPARRRWVPRAAPGRGTAADRRQPHLASGIRHGSRRDVQAGG